MKTTQVLSYDIVYDQYIYTSHLEPSDSSYDIDIEQVLQEIKTALHGVLYGGGFDAGITGSVTVTIDTDS